MQGTFQHIHQHIKEIRRIIWPWSQPSDRAWQCCCASRRVFQECQPRGQPCFLTLQALVAWRQLWLSDWTWCVSPNSPPSANEETVSGVWLKCLQEVSLRRECPARRTPGPCWRDYRERPVIPKNMKIRLSRGGTPKRACCCAKAETSVSVTHTNSHI